VPDVIVYTVDSREHLLLGILEDDFGVAGAAMRREIVEGVKETKRLLELKRVKYSDLRACLTPQSDKLELALFANSRIAGSWYGPPIHQVLLPLLRKSGPHSVLHGDLLYEEEAGGRIWHILGEEVLCPRPVQVGYLIEIYCVYVNNCSPRLATEIVRAFETQPWFIGYADVTFASPLKTYLSGCVGEGYITHRNTVIQAHADDAPEQSDENTLGYPFEEAGFTCRSIASLYFELFLSYKIERPVLRGFERDQVHALNAVTDSPGDIANCTIDLPDDKFEYLRRAKTGTLRRLGVLEQPKATLETLVRAKLRSNYLYNLHFRPDFSVSTFNIMLELQSVDDGERVRTVASFAYEAERNVIRLVTLY
jgi:hypothetical protein